MTKQERKELLIAVLRKWPSATGAFAGVRDYSVMVTFGGLRESKLDFTLRAESHCKLLEVIESRKET